MEPTIENLEKFALEVALANHPLVNFHLWETKEGELVVESNKQIGKRPVAVMEEVPKSPANAGVDPGVFAVAAALMPLDANAEGTDANAEGTDANAEGTDANAEGTDDGSPQS